MSTTRTVSASIKIALSLSLLLAPALAPAQVNITTERYDNARTGSNLSETQLNDSVVNVSTFGKLWAYTVSGSVQAQPLYVSGVPVAGGGTVNILYVATMNDVVYAFNADSYSNVPVWSVDLSKQVAGAMPVPITDITHNNTLNIVGNVGIESTPVIDLSTNTMYLVARTKENGTYPQRLHALDITTGAEKFGGPVAITASLAGVGTASVGGVLTFDPKIHNQRSSLALANGQIYIGWASHEDENPYHGWIMSYSASTLAQTGVFCTTPDGAEGGVWMAGHAPAVDLSNNVYYSSGNGDWNGTREFSDSFLKFGPGIGMPLLDWFTPDNYSYLGSQDVDLGSTGPMLIPGTDLLVEGSKQSFLYVMHTGQLGHEQTGNGQIVQILNNHGGDIKAGVVYWNRQSGVGPWLYVWSEGGDHLKAYHFNGTTFDPQIVSQSVIASPPGNAGGVLALSSNGGTAGSGIVWSSMSFSDNADHGVHAGILRAFDADDLTKELWDSRQYAARDDIGNWPKYSPPVVANGRVYMASFPSDGVSNTSVSVFGVLGSVPTAPPTLSPAPGQFSWPQQITITSATPAASIYYTTDGSVPTTSSPLYSGPVPISGSMVINAMAVSNGLISAVVSGTYVITPPDVLPNGGWTLAYADNQAPDHTAVQAFDAQNSTFWLTSDSSNSPAPPHFLQINLGGTYSLGGFTYMPRQDGCSNGLISQYDFSVSTDGVNWGTPVASGQFNYGASYVYACTPRAGPSTQIVSFAPVTASYVQFRGLSEVGGNPWTAISEFGLIHQAALPRTGWALLYADSQQAAAGNGAAVSAFDGSPKTYWHSRYSPTLAPLPHEIQIDLGAAYYMTGFTYLPRQDGCSHGTVLQYEFYVSTDGINWGTPVAAGNFNWGTAKFACLGSSLLPKQQINFTATTGRYIRFRALSEVQGNPWTSAAEIGIVF